MATTLVMDALRLAQFNSATYAAPDWDTDALYFLLVTATGAAVADATKQGYTWESDLNANEVSGTGYTARGQALTSLAATQSSHVVKLTSAAPAWTSSTITASGGYVISHKSTAGTSPALCYNDFGGSFTSTAGTFTVNPNTLGWVSVS